MRVRSFAVLAAMVVSVAALAQPAPETVDMSRIGPQVGAIVPAFSGVDQFGKPRTLASTLRSEGRDARVLSLRRLVTVLQNAARGAAKPLRRHHQAGAWLDRDQLRRARDAQEVRGLARDHVSADLGRRARRSSSDTVCSTTPSIRSRAPTAFRIPAPSSSIARAWCVSRFFEDAYQERYTAATILSTLGAGGRRWQPFRPTPRTCR